MEPGGPEPRIVKYWFWRAADMSILNRLFGKQAEPPKRVRVCVECGMPVAEHKQWCSILQGEKELKDRGLRLSADRT
jgi:hypothetical protein